MNHKRSTATSVAGWIGAVLLSCFSAVIAFGITCVATASLDSSGQYGIPNHWEAWLALALFVGGAVFVLVLVLYGRSVARAAAEERAKFEQESDADQRKPEA